MDPIRIGFVVGSRSRVRHRGLTLKRRIMRLEGLVYPDVFSLPYFLAPRFDFIRDGTAVPRGRYDLILAELNHTEEQLEYLDALLSAGVAPLALIPGPPELLARVLNDRRMQLATHLLRRATTVWAYSETIRSFCDGLIGERKSDIIPWPFDYEGTRRIGMSRDAAGGPIHVALNIPLRFSGVEEYPWVLRALVMDALAEMERAERERFRFYTVVYTAQDREAFQRTGYGEGWSLRLERKRGYASFVRFLGRCDGVINLTSAGILGRVTFLAAALDRPGVFSDNAELNRTLYPASNLPLLDTQGLRAAIGGLLRGLAAGRVAPAFLPDRAVAQRVGDYPANAERLRSLLRGHLPAAAE